MKCAACLKEFKDGETMKPTTLDGVPAIIHPDCQPTPAAKEREA